MVSIKKGKIEYIKKAIYHCPHTSICKTLSPIFVQDCIIIKETEKNKNKNKFLKIRVIKSVNMYIYQRKIAYTPFIIIC